MELRFQNRFTGHTDIGFGHKNGGIFHTEVGFVMISKHVFSKLI